MSDMATTLRELLERFSAQPRITVVVYNSHGGNTYRVLRYLGEVLGKATLCVGPGGLTSEHGERVRVLVLGERPREWRDLEATADLVLSVGNGWAVRESGGFGERGLAYEIP